MARRITRGDAEAILNAFGTGGFDSWQNLLIVLGWLAVSLTGAAILLKRRDA